MPHHRLRYLLHIEFARFCIDTLVPVSFDQQLAIAALECILFFCASACIFPLSCTSHTQWANWKLENRDAKTLSKEARAIDTIACTPNNTMRRPSLSTTRTHFATWPNQWQKDSSVRRLCMATTQASGHTHRRDSSFCPWDATNVRWNSEDIVEDGEAARIPLETSMCNTLRPCDNCTSRFFVDHNVDRTARWSTQPRGPSEKGKKKNQDQKKNQERRNKNSKAKDGICEPCWMKYRRQNPGTSMITMTIPPKEQMSRVLALLWSETATHRISNRAFNRNSVVAVLKTVFATQKNQRTPAENGWLIYASADWTRSSNRKKFLSPHSPTFVERNWTCLWRWFDKLKIPPAL